MTSSAATATQRTALVTGSTSGIGAVTARRLAHAGYLVVVTGRDADRAADVVSGIAADGGRAVFVPSDLSAEPDVLREFAQAARDAAGGHIDVVVHNAAVCYAVSTPDLSDDLLTSTLAVNIRAPHVLTAALAPAMAEHGQGSIVVIGSWMATVGHPFAGLYAASKAAEAQLARSWAAEFGPRGVRVNTVAPGAIQTPINKDATAVLQTLTASTPAGRPGDPHEIAATVTWLVSDEARYVHGATIAVDGGITAADVSGA